MISDSTKALPGPYTVDEEGWITSGLPGAYSDIAACFWIDSNKAEWHEPTLKLMLAAPDLLEALKLTLSELESWHKSESWGPEGETIIKARAAIAKATGEG